MHCLVVVSTVENAVGRTLEVCQLVSKSVLLHSSVYFRRRAERPAARVGGLCCTSMALLCLFFLRAAQSETARCDCWADCAVVWMILRQNASLMHLAKDDDDDH